MAEKKKGVITKIKEFFEFSSAKEFMAEWKKLTPKEKGEHSSLYGRHSLLFLMQAFKTSKETKTILA